MFLSFTSWSWFSWLNCFSLLLMPWPQSVPLMLVALWPLPPGAGRTTSWVGFAAESADCAADGRRRSPRVGLNGEIQCPALDALRPGRGRATGKDGWGLAQDAACPGCRSVAAATWGKWGAWRATRRGRWLFRQPPRRWQPRCKGKRPASRRCRRTAEAWGTCGAVAATRQPHRRHWNAAGACRRLQPQDEDCEAGWTAPPGGPDGCGNPGCRAVSLGCLLN